MKPRSLLLLLALVVVLGAFLWFVDRDLPSSEERAERSKKVLGGLEADEVRAVVLEWGDHRVRLEREPEAAAMAGGEGAGEGIEGEIENGVGIEAAPAWRLTEPAAIAPARADGAAVDRLLDAVLGLERIRTVEDVEPAAMGLDEPRARVTLITGEEGEGGAGGRAETVLEIGSPVPASMSILVAVAGRPDAFVVAGGIYDQLTRAPGDWRDRRIFAGDRGEIQRVTLYGGPAGEPVVLARRGEEFWLDGPIVDRADRDKVDRLLTDLTALSAERFVDQPDRPLAELGLEPPRMLVEAALGHGGELFRLELGELVGEGATSRYSRAGGQLFEVQSPLAEAVERPVGDWQSPVLSGLRMYQIDRAVVRRDGSELTLSRDVGEWLRDGVKISYTPVSEFLYALTDARASRLLRRTEARRRGAALAAPTLTVTLGTAGTAGEGGAEETLALHPPVPALDGGVPATASGRDFVLVLPGDVGTKILDAFDHLAEAEAVEPVADATPADADAVAVDADAGDPDAQ